MQEIVEAGLARVVDWSASFLPNEEVIKLRTAEMKAKKANLRLWKDWVGKNILLVEYYYDFYLMYSH